MKKSVCSAVVMAVLAVCAISVCSCGNNSKNDSEEEESAPKPEGYRQFGKLGETFLKCVFGGEQEKAFQMMRACRPPKEYDEGELQEEYYSFSDFERSLVDCLSEMCVRPVGFKYIGGYEVGPFDESDSPRAYGYYSFGKQEKAVIGLCFDQFDGDWLVCRSYVENASDLIEQFLFLKTRAIIQRDEICEAAASFEKVLDAMKSYFSEEELEKIKEIKGYRTIEDLPEEDGPFRGYEDLIELEEYVEEDVEEEEPIPFQLVEVKPSFNGGDDNEFSEWVAQHLQYPEIAKENGVQGRVMLSFRVEKDGSVSNVKVLRGVDPSLDKEAVRVISSSPRWKPGKQRDRVVPVTYIFPVIFQLR